MDADCKSRVATQTDEGGLYLAADTQSEIERAYATVTPQEYFAECTEAYFSRNDFSPSRGTN